MIDDIITRDVHKVCEDLDRTRFVGKSVLLTGGAGFLGSWITDVLLELGSNVTCVDNFSTGQTTNIDHLSGNQLFRLVRSDVTRLDIGGKYDYLLHLASRASPDEYRQHPIETLLANSVGTSRMLELARQLDSRILYTSTSEIYGDAQVVPTSEDYWGHVNPIGERSCYDEGKRFGEAIFMAYRREHNLDTRIVRIFNTYGPRIRATGSYARSVPRFIHQALSGETITVYGDGSQTRSFCYVSDTILGILRLLTTPEACGEVVNIGSPRETSILELATKIKKMVGSRSEIGFGLLPQDDPRRRSPNISKAEKILAWKPSISLDDGLSRTIEWFRNNPQA